MPERESPSLGAVIVIILCAFAVVLLITPASGAARRTANQMKNSANLRGIDQSMVIFGNSHNDYLPGLDATGKILPASPSSTGSKTNSGAAISSRLWILLNEQYIGGDLIVNPSDSMQKWTSGHALTTANFSYAGLQIGDNATTTDTANQQGRAAEWKNNANSQAIMLSDRNVSMSNADSDVQTCWWTLNRYMFCLLATHTHAKGAWKGNLVWGDNHAEFTQTWRGFDTRYAAAVNTDDNLFATQAAPGVTEPSAASDANAMMIYY